MGLKQEIYNREEEFRKIFNPDNIFNLTFDEWMKGSIGNWIATRINGSSVSMIYGMEAEPTLLIDKIAKEYFS